MFLVVGCTHCGAPRVVEQGTASSTCPRCSKRFQLDKAIVHAKVEDRAMAADAVGQLNAQRAGGELVRANEPRSAAATDAIDEALQAARTISGEAARVRAAAEGLTQRFEAFDGREWAEAMERLDIAPERGKVHLERLAQDGAVTVPRQGLYQWVG